LREAVQSGIPVVALVDTNCDPSLVDFVIPGNDDSAKSVGLILEILGDAVKAGKELSAKAKLEKKADVKKEVKVEPIHQIEEVEVIPGLADLDIEDKD